MKRRKKKPETIEDVLGPPKGPFGRPGRMTGWRRGPGGRLVPYDITLPEEACPYCKRFFYTRASLENHIILDHPKK